MWSPMNEENILSLLFFPEMNVCIYRMSPLQKKEMLPYILNCSLVPYR